MYLRSINCSLMCNSFVSFRVLGNAWILTRDKFPSLEIMDRAYAVLDKNHINRDHLIKTDQSNCPDPSYEIDNRPLFDFSFNNHVDEEPSTTPAPLPHDYRLRRRVDHSGIMPWMNNKRRIFIRRTWGMQCGSCPVKTCTLKILVPKVEK